MKDKKDFLGEKPLRKQIMFTTTISMDLLGFRRDFLRGEKHPASLISENY